MDNYMKERLASKIYKELEYDILRGFYPVNTKLPPERELAERFKTSRFVIRESIAMLINAGLAETRPQSGTFIKNYFDDTTLDSLIRILQSANSMELKTFDSFMNYKLTNDVANIGKAAEGIAKDELDVIETLILKKRLNDDLQVLAECDVELFHEITIATLDPISIAVSFTLKPLRTMVIKMVYDLFEDKKTAIDNIIESDIRLYRALASHDSEKAMEAIKEKIAVFENLIMKIDRFENGKIYLNTSDREDGTAIKK